MISVFVHQDYAVETHAYNKNKTKSAFFYFAFLWAFWFMTHGLLPKMQLHFSVTCCHARSSNSNYWAREKRIIQPALLQVFVEPYSWEVEDDFHSEQTFLWTSFISSSLCMWCLLTPWMLMEIALLIKDISMVFDGRPVASDWTVRYSWKSKIQ